MNLLTSASSAPTDGESWYVADGKDPLPKPLRITKKRIKFSTSKKTLRRGSIIFQAFSSRESHSGGFSVPRRLSSAAFARRADASSTSVSSKSSTASSAGCSKVRVENPRSPLPSTKMLRQNGTLSVRKHRSRDNASSLSAIGSSTSEGIPRNQHIFPSSLPPLAEQALDKSKRPTTPTSQKACDDEDTPRATRPSNRSVTAGPRLETEPVSSSYIQTAPLIRQASTAFDHIDLRRFTSTRERPTPTHFLQVSHKVNDPGPTVGFANPGSRHALPRKPSVKHSLISRVLSGFRNKPQSSMATNPTKIGGDLERRFSYASSGPTQPLLDRPMKDHSARPRATTASSTERAFRSSELGPAIAAFPPPPSFASTSPTDVGPLPIPVHTSRTLLKPEDPIILSAGLKILPEIESIDSDGGQTIWVAVEVSGDLKMPGRMSQARKTRHGLIVAVVIDNSSFSSPSALMSSCELVVKIASFLDMADDKMAVLCAYGDSTIQSSGAQFIIPLRPVNVRKVQSLLNVVQSSNGSIGQQEHYLEEAMKTAFEVLSHSNSQPVPEASSRALSGHVFLITANTDYVPLTSLKNDTSHVHIIHPGIVPWNCRKELSNNGWQLRSMYPPKLESIALSSDESGLPAKIRALIQYARTGNQPGSLSDLVLDIRPGPDCKNEGMMGSLEIASLRPGEVVSVFVKLKLGRFPLAFSALSTFQLVSNETNSTADLLAQLGTMTGERGTEILSVGLSYKHSLLPGNTQLHVTATSRLRRRVPESSWDGYPPVSNANQGKDRQVQIQRRMAFFFATHHTPSRALSTLQAFFENKECKVADPVYIRLVMEELRYQARLVERFDLLDDDPVSKRSSIESAYTSRVGGPLSNITNQPATTPSPHRRHPPTAIKDDASVDRPTSQGSGDKAHKIWADIRKNSRGTRDRDSTQPEITDENARQLQQMALKNKRSFGADTLRSFVQAERTFM